MQSSPHHLTALTLPSGLGEPTLPGGQALSCTSSVIHPSPDSEQPFSTPNDPPLAESKLE